MSASIRVKRSAVRQFLPADYAGNRIFVVPCLEVTFRDLNWSEGNRNVFSAVRLADARQASLALLGAPAPWCNAAEGHTVALEPGFAIVERSYSGIYETIRIHVHPSDMPRLLPAPVASTVNLLA